MIERQVHEESLSAPGWCHVCRQRWPCYVNTLEARVVELEAENARLEGWGENTMDGCVGSLTKARDALYGVLTALGLGYGASALLDELDEAIRQLGAGRG